jgi:hypothetical protein
MMCTNLGSGEDVLDRHGNLGTNAITLDQTDEEVALRILSSVVLGNPVARVVSLSGERPGGGSARGRAQALPGHRAGERSKGQHLE